MGILDVESAASEMKRWDFLFLILVPVAVMLALDLRL